MPALPDQNVDSSVLRSRIREYEQVIAAQSAQLMVSATWNKLFHLENGQLRQIALKKTTRQKNKFLNTKARVMTSPEGLDEIKADEERRAAKAAEKAAKAVARAEKAELKGKRGTGGQKGQKVRFQVKDNTSDTASDAATSDSDTDRLSNAQPTHRTTRSGLSAKSNSTGLHADPSKAPQAAAQDTPVTLRRGRSATAQKENPKRLSTGIKSSSSPNIGSGNAATPNTVGVSMTGAKKTQGKRFKRPNPMHEISYEEDDDFFVLNPAARKCNRGS